MNNFFGNSVQSLKELDGLTQHQIDQLSNMGSYYLSNQTWGCLSSASQDLSPNSDFGVRKLTVSNSSGLTVGSVTLNSTQWGYLGALNQSVSSAATPQFTRVGIGASCSRCFKCA